MRTIVVSTPSLSPTSKAALAVWLAQAPPAPDGGSSEHLAICARLAASAIRRDNGSGAARAADTSDSDQSECAAPIVR
jgi:hypothetical protein